MAGISDLVQITLFPMFFEGAASPFDVVLDLATVAVLVPILGFKWRLLLGFGLEMVPGLDLFPTWTALVFSLSTEAGPREAEMKNVTPGAAEAEAPQPLRVLPVPPEQEDGAGPAKGGDPPPSQG